MYNSYFGFLESPFENKLDQKFLFLSDDHQEVLAALLYFIKEEKGFAIVCGDVGTGKTMLINTFLGTLPPSVQPIIISNPNVMYLELLHYIARTLQIPTGGKSVLELSDEVKEALIAARRQGKIYFLIVDEAHLLSDASLEDIRLLSNIETQEQKLLQILLVGQYELSYKLDRPEMRQLRQRINISRFLSPLNPAETIQYIDHRLGKVGADFASCFEANCRSLAFKMTDGVPRRINQLCDSALLICMTEGLRKVNRRILKKAGEALLTDLLFTPKSHLGKGSPGRWKLAKFLVPAVAGLALLLLGGILAQNGWWGSRAHLLPVPEIAGAQAPGHEIRTGPEVAGAPGKAAATAPRQETGPGQAAAARIATSPAAGQPETGRGMAAANPAAALAVPAPPPVSGPPAVAGLAPGEKNPGALTGGGSMDNNATLLAGAAKPASMPQGLATQSGMPEPAPAPAGLATSPAPAATPETGRAAATGLAGTASGEPGRAVDKLSTFTPAATQTVVARGDYLNKVASRWYPGNSDMGMEAIILANLKSSREDLIYPGQVLFLPKLNLSQGIIQLQDNLFYAPYGHYRAFEQLQQAMARLNQHKVRYLLINTISGDGGTTHRIFLGGYEQFKDLERAMKILATTPG